MQELSAAGMKFTIKRWLVAVALFALAHRVFLSPFFWLSFYPWAWLCHADWVFIATGRQFDAAMPGSVFCLVAGVLVQVFLIGCTWAIITEARQRAAKNSHHSIAPLPGDAPLSPAGAQQNQVSK